MDNGSKPKHKAHWRTRLHVIIPRDQLPGMESWSQKNGFKITGATETLEVFLERPHSSEEEAKAQAEALNNDEDFQEMWLLHDMPEYLTIAKRIEFE